MHGREGLPRPYGIRQMDLEHGAAPVALDFGDVAVAEAARGGVARMQRDRRLGPMARKPYGFPGARHGVPLVAHAAGVQTQWPVPAGRVNWLARHRRDEPGAAVGMEEAARSEEASVALGAIGARRPDEGAEIAITVVADRGMGADIEIACAIILERREGGMLADDIGDPLPSECGAEPK